MEHKGVIYILTNPSFPQFVKIGYADNVEERLNQLNRSECIPYAFRLYAYYKVPARLTDMKLHRLVVSHRKYVSISFSQLLFFFLLFMIGPNSVFFLFYFS